jgi:DNA polymerase-4
MTRDVIHVDIDAFLASVEQVRDPSLRGRAVIVGGERGERGLVLSSSYEARRFGVKPGLSISQAERLLPDAVFLKGDYQRARVLSDRTWEICRRYTPLVEVTSLDDCYLDVSGTERLFGPAHRVAARIGKEVAKEVGFRLSLGVGGNRTAARVATVFAKPGKVAEVPRGREAEFLAPLPVRRLPGVGHRTERTLYRYNVRTIGQLARIPLPVLAETFGAAAGRLLSERARGIDEQPVRPDRAPRSVSRETSLSPATADREVLEGMLYYLLERAAGALRDSGHRARTLAVKLYYADGPGSARSKTLIRPTNRERDLYGEARLLFAGLHTRRVRLSLIGVTLSGLVRAEGEQGCLFTGDPFTGDLLTDEDHRRIARLTDGLDRIRRRFGFRAVTAGRSIDLLGRLPQNEHGFVLKTPSLTR